MPHIMRTSDHLGFLLAIVAILSTAACSGDSVQPGPEYPSTLDVFTPGNVFSPPIAEIALGGTVRFLMTESPDGDGHNAIFNRTLPGAPIDVPIVVDSTVSRTFTTRGEFSYFCTVHPGMSGEIIVH